MRPHIDVDQMGEVPRCSVEHYIVNMINFILMSMDGDPEAAVLSVAVDYRKAFNRMRHANILNSLSALNHTSHRCKMKVSEKSWRRSTRWITDMVFFSSCKSIGQEALAHQL